MEAVERKSEPEQVQFGIVGRHIADLQLVSGNGL